MLFDVGDEFVRRDGRGAEFADNDTGGGVGKMRSRFEVRSRGQREYEGGERGVTGARDILDFTCGGGDGGADRTVG